MKSSKNDKILCLRIHYLHLRYFTHINVTIHFPRDDCYSIMTKHL